MADLSARYARALFELAVERGLVSDYMQQAAFISAEMSNEECKSILTHPQIPMAEKHAFLNGAFDGRVHEDLLGFMHLTVTKNREEYLTPALDELVETIRRHQNFTTARVVSAMPLTPMQENQLKAALIRKLGKQVELVVEVDAYLIGGFRLHVDGHVFDRSIRRMLKDMKADISTAV